MCLPKVTSHLSLSSPAHCPIRSDFNYQLWFSRSFEASGSITPLRTKFCWASDLLSPLLMQGTTEDSQSTSICRLVFYGWKTLHFSSQRISGLDASCDRNLVRLTSRSCDFEMSLEKINRLFCVIYRMTWILIRNTNTTICSHEPLVFALLIILFWVMRCQQSWVNHWGFEWDNGNLAWNRSDR